MKVGCNKIYTNFTLIYNGYLNIVYLIQTAILKMLIQVPGVCQRNKTTRKFCVSPLSNSVVH